MEWRADEGLCPGGFRFCGLFPFLSLTSRTRPPVDRHSYRHGRGRAGTHPAAGHHTSSLTFSLEISMKELLTFETMITPKIITVVYYIALLMVFAFGISLIFNERSVIMGIFKGVVTIALGSLGVRVYCELCIVFFKMNESLAELRKK
jgi:hypothetical protein